MIKTEYNTNQAKAVAETLKEIKQVYSKEPDLNMTFDKFCLCFYLQKIDLQLQRIACDTEAIASQ